MPSIDYRITAVVVTEKTITQKGREVTQLVYTDQTGQVIRRSFNRYGAISAGELGIPSFHKDVHNAKAAIARVCHQQPQLGATLRIIEITEATPALDTETPVVVESNQEATQAAATKEQGMYVNGERDSSDGAQSENLVISWGEGVKGVPADAEGNGFVQGVAGTCRCGCGGEVKTGSKFLPGHDARLKGKLMRAVLAGVQVEVNGEAPVSPLEAAYTDEFDYRTTVQSAMDRAAAQGQTAEEKAAEKAAKAEAKAAAKAEAKAALDARVAERKAEREAEATRKREAREAAKAEKAATKAAAAEAAQLAKDSAGTVDPAKAEEVESVA